MKFDLEGHEYIELYKLLKATGQCDSGGSAKVRISEGLAEVDGQVELRKRCKIRAGQSVRYAGQLFDIE